MTTAIIGGSGMETWPGAEVVERRSVTTPFGEPSAPLVNVGIGAATAGIGGIPDVLGDQPALGVPFVGFVLLGTWFAYLALSVLPTVIPKAAER